MCLGERMLNIKIYSLNLYIITYYMSMSLLHGQSYAVLKAHGTCSFYTFGILVIVLDLHER